MLQRKPGDGPVDGRRVRGADNRRKIVSALLKRVEAGSVFPNAEEVAKEAGVGLRTVFRHFADMESLYSEVSERMTAEIRPIVEKPFESDTWQGRVAELVERRAQIFEHLLPFKAAGDSHRPSSEYLSTQHRALVAMQREALRRALTPEVMQNKPFIEALDLLLSLDSWRRLRHDQGVSAREAREALRFAALALTSSVGGKE